MHCVRDALDHLCFHEKYDFTNGCFRDNTPELPDYPGLLDGLEIGNFGKDLATHCFTPITNYIRHVDSSWEIYFRKHLALRPLLDPQTVQRVEGLAPSASRVDRQVIIERIDSGHIFRRIPDPQARQSFKEELLSLDIVIPSLTTYHKNMLYFSIAAKVLRKHVEVDVNIGKEKVVSDLFDNLYRIWHPRKSLVEVSQSVFKPVPGPPSSTLAFEVILVSIFRNFAQLCYTPPLQDHRSDNPTRAAEVDSYILQLCKKLEILGFSNSRIESRLKRTAPFLSASGPARAEDPCPYVDGFRPWRFGKPSTSVYLWLQRNAFLPAMSQAQPVGRFPHPLFVLSDLLGAFFKHKPHMHLVSPEISVSPTALATVSGSSDQMQIDSLQDIGGCEVEQEHVLPQASAFPSPMKRNLDLNGSRPVLGKRKADHGTERAGKRARIEQSNDIWEVPASPAGAAPKSPVGRSLPTSPAPEPANLLGRETPPRSPLRRTPSNSLSSSRNQTGLPENARPTPVSKQALAESASSEPEHLGLANENAATREDGESAAHETSPSPTAVSATVEEFISLYSPRSSPASPVLPRETVSTLEHQQNVPPPEDPPPEEVLLDKVSRRWGMSFSTPTVELTPLNPETRIHLPSESARPEPTASLATNHVLRKKRSADSEKGGTVKRLRVKHPQSVPNERMKVKEAEPLLIRKRKAEEIQEPERNRLVKSREALEPPRKRNVLTRQGTWAAEHARGQKPTGGGVQGSNGHSADGMNLQTGPARAVGQLDRHTGSPLKKIDLPILGENLNLATQNPEDSQSVQDLSQTRTIFVYDSSSERASTPPRSALASPEETGSNDEGQLLPDRDQEDGGTAQEDSE